jgi:hypothetical protein
MVALLEMAMGSRPPDAMREATSPITKNPEL